MVTTWGLAYIVSIQVLLLLPSPTAIVALSIVVVVHHSPATGPSYCTGSLYTSHLAASCFIMILTPQLLFKLFSSPNVPGQEDGPIL